MLKFYNTLNRKKIEFETLRGKTVRMYSCGPTVYDFAHIGNLRTYIFVDVLRRTFLYNNYEVKHVMNITDVGHLTEDDREEDKIESRARREKKSAWDIARFYEKAFFDDLKKLNILHPKIVARATDHINEQIKLVEQLEIKGYTYKTRDGIYFDVSRLADYGKLTGQKLSEKQAGARVTVSNDKRNPQDFALWKFSKPTLKRHMEWSSPWGKGFPGWHLECSAMSVKYLGQPFDIHTGGIDHIGTHHTNEIAETEGATGKPLANFWLHGEFLTVDGKRMGKSEGNLITLKDLQAKGLHPLAYRYLVLSAHYRSSLNFTWESLQAANNTLNNIYDQLRDWNKASGITALYEQKFLASINDDLNMPQALALLHELLEDERYSENARAATLLRFDKVLGLDFYKYLGKKIHIPAAIIKLVKDREAARKKFDWKLADELRNKVQKLGFAIEDKDKGWKIKELT